MNYGDHNFIEITQQSKLRVEPVELDFIERVDRLARAVLFDNVDTAKMHGLDTSNVSSRVESCRVELSGIWAYTSNMAPFTIVDRIRSLSCIEAGATIQGFTVAHLPVYIPVNTCSL